MNDVPLSNTSFKNKPTLEEDQREQDARGRLREKEDTDLPVQDDMISLMGFAGFGSTKGKHVEGSKGGSAKKEKKSEYRQYMNRLKGFNRALSPGR